MTEFALAWACSAVVFFAADLVWLAVVAKSFYRDRIGHLMADRFRGGPAVAFYVVYIAGIVWFAVGGADRWQDAALDGALLGFFCYGTYNLTNFATLRGWPLSLVLVDMTWGTALTGATATAGFWMKTLIG